MDLSYTFLLTAWIQDYNLDLAKFINLFSVGREPSTELFNLTQGHFLLLLEEEWGQRREMWERNTDWLPLVHSPTREQALNSGTWIDGNGTSSALV